MDLVGLPLKGLFDFCQGYGLKSLITKKDLSLVSIHTMILTFVKIFEERLDLKKTGALENRLSYAAFELALIDIANRIYGGKPFCNTYQTVESRLDKLISKLILAYEEDKEIQGCEMLNNLRYVLIYIKIVDGKLESFNR